MIIDNLCQVGTSLRDSGLEVTVPVFSSLLRKILQGVRIPYEGEPLSGIQVMGILETRNLDFENVLILSANDDTFPGNLAAGASFIPHNLRLAYGLPTPMHHEGVYAYYFYRLLQRASVVHIAYCSRSDDKHTGEPSRYIYQLDYESPHDVVRTQVPLSVSLAPQHPLAVPKTGEVAERLHAFLDGGDVLFRLRRSMPISNVPSNSVSAVLNGSGPRRRSPRRSICRCSGRSCTKRWNCFTRRC